MLTSEYPPYTWGGVGRYSKEVVERLREHSIVDVIDVPTYAVSAGQIGDSHCSSSPRGNSIHLRSATHDQSESMLDPFNEATQVTPNLAEWLRNDYDVLFVQDYFTAQLAVDIFLSGYASRMVAYSHLPLYAGFSYFDRPGAIDRQHALESMIFRLSAAVITPSKFAAGVILQSHNVTAERLRVLPPGVTMPESQSHSFANHDGDSISLLVVSRLTHQKGLAYLPDLVSQLTGRGINCRVVVIGRGPLADRLQESLRAERVQGVVEFVSQVDQESEVFDYYRSARILVSLSLYETFGFAVLEGMSRGCVPVGFAIEGIRELVGPELAKSFADIGDVPALVNRIELLSLDSRLLQLEAERAIDQALKYSWSDHVRALLELFEGLM